MRCDKLKAVFVDTTGNIVANELGELYYRPEVDAAIAELKEFAENACLERDDNQTAIDELQDENAQLKQKLENVQASMYCDVVDANMEIRRLKRALWLARAERAKDSQQLFHFSLGYDKLCIDGFYDPYSGRRELSPKQWIKVFNKVETKCQAKAEEYR